MATQNKNKKIKCEQNRIIIFNVKNIDFGTNRHKHKNGNKF